MPVYSMAGGYYKSASIELSAQTCINLYPQAPQTKKTINSTSLFSTPGISIFSNVSNVGSRGMFLFNNILYVVNGTSIYKIASNGSVTNIGTIDPGDKVSVANNGLIIAIVVPETGNGYFSDGVTVTQITDNNFAKPARTVTYIDGTFVFNNDNTIFVSSTFVNNNGQSFDGLDFGTAEIDPDPILSVHNVNNQLYAVGRYTIEVFRNIGGEGFPFQRVPGASINKGTVSRFGFINFNNGYAFMGSSRHEGNSIWASQNNQISKISTSAIDLILSKLTITEEQNVKLFSYSDNGNFFLLIELPTTTLVYDVTTSGMAGIPIWHERKSKNNTTKWLFNDSIRAYGATLMTDSISGNIGLLDNNISTEYDETPLRTATGAYLSNQGVPLFIDDLELVGKSGVGDSLSGTNIDPLVYLSWSDDGGHTFNTPIGRSMGSKGNFTRRPIWHRIGRFNRSRVFKIDWQNNKAFVANVLWINGSQGTR